MAAIYSRRRLLVAASVAVLGGCVSSGEEDPGADGDQPTEADGEQNDGADTPTAKPTPTDDTVTMTPSDRESERGEGTPVPPEDRGALVAQLPDVSPLVGSLEDIVAAADRKAVAADHGYEFREEDHSVRVVIELEPDGELPAGYRVAVQDEYGGQVTAFVHVDDLVPLAMADSVRKIQRPPESRPHGGGAGQSSR